MTDFRAPIDQNKQGQQPASEPSSQVVQPTQAPVASQSPVINSNVQANGEMKEWPLDRFIKKLIGFIAKMTWQPDPVTWEVNSPTMSWNVAQKVWTTTNEAISTVGNVADKFTDVAKKTVNVTGSVVNKVGDVAKKSVEVASWAVNQVKEIKEDIQASINPETKTTQPLDNLEKTE